MINLILPIGVITVVAIGGYALRLLTASGMFAALLLGLVVFLGLGVKGLLILGIFFFTSSLWSKYKHVQKQRIEERHEKGSQRDWQQVFANGGMGLIASLFYLFTKDQMWIVIYCIVIACANSDTWASEIGSLSRSRPIYVKTLKRVERGTSGAVSLLGTVAALFGSLLIALSGLLLWQLPYFDAYFIFIFGFVGNIIDTYFGAFIQVTYRCHKCGSETEKLSHCGTGTKKIKGFSFFNNDAVNFLSIFITAIIAYIIIK